MKAEGGLTVGVTPSPCRARSSVGGASSAPRRSSALSGASDLDLVSVPLGHAQTDPLFGATICKGFGERLYYGRVVNIDRDIHTGERAYHIAYEDGDEEHLLELEVRSCLVRAGGSAAGALQAAGPAAWPTPPRMGAAVAGHREAGLHSAGAPGVPGAQPLGCGCGPPRRHWMEAFGRGGLLAALVMLAFAVLCGAPLCWSCVWGSTVDDFGFQETRMDSLGSELSQPSHRVETTDPREGLQPQPMIELASPAPEEPTLAEVAPPVADSRRLEDMPARAEPVPIDLSATLEVRDPPRVAHAQEPLSAPTTGSLPVLGESPEPPPRKPVHEYDALHHEVVPTAPVKPVEEVGHPTEHAPREEPVSVSEALAEEPECEDVARPPSTPPEEVPADYEYDAASSASPPEDSVIGAMLALAEAFGTLGWAAAKGLEDVVSELWQWVMGEKASSNTSDSSESMGTPLTLMLAGLAVILASSMNNPGQAYPPGPGGFAPFPGVAPPAGALAPGTPLGAPAPGTPLGAPGGITAPGTPFAAGGGMAAAASPPPQASQQPGTPPGMLPPTMAAMSSSPLAAAGMAAGAGMPAAFAPAMPVAHAPQPQLGAWYTTYVNGEERIVRVATANPATGAVVVQAYQPTKSRGKVTFRKGRGGDVELPAGSLGLGPFQLVAGHAPAHIEARFEHAADVDGDAVVGSRRASVQGVAAPPPAPAAPAAAAAARQPRASAAAPRAPRASVKPAAAAAALKSRFVVDSGVGRFRYTAALRKMDEMGFTDGPELRDLLTRHEGNVPSAMREIMGEGGVIS